jgi:hypothetical protein
MTFEVRLILHKKEVRGACLSAAGRKRHPRLGLDTFVLEGSSTQDREDISYLLRP